MALGSNSYGDTDEIAALIPRRASSGSFDETTRPTLAQLESIVNQVSAVVNAVLSQAGFSIPISQADAKLMLDLFVNQEAAAIVEGINGSGRFGPTAKRTGGKGRFTIIMEDVEAFIKAQAVGIERLGATRTYDPIAGIGYRSTDVSGDSISPIFQREAFGNAFDDWDS